MQLLLLATAALLASTSASPSGYWPPAPLCQCTNPFLGTRNSYRGDPDSLCSPGGPGFCYVACDRACRDQRDTASAAR